MGADIEREDRMVRPGDPADAKPCETPMTSIFRVKVASVRTELHRWKCPECPSSFGRPDSLKQHLQRKPDQQHQLRALMLNETKCRKCKRRFKTIGALSNHSRRFCRPGTFINTTVKQGAAVVDVCTSNPEPQSNARNDLEKSKRLSSKDVSWVKTVLTSEAAVEAAAARPLNVSKQHSPVEDGIPLERATALTSVGPLVSSPGRLSARRNAGDASPLADTTWESDGGIAAKAGPSNGQGRMISASTFTEVSCYVGAANSLLPRATEEGLASFWEGGYWPGAATGQEFWTPNLLEGEDWFGMGMPATGRELWPPSLQDEQWPGAGIPATRPWSLAPPFLDKDWPSAGIPATGQELCSPPDDADWSSASILKERRGSVQVESKVPRTEQNDAPSF